MAQHLRRWGSVVVLALLGVAVALNWDDVTDALDVVGGLSPGRIGVLLAFVVGGTVVNGAYTAAVTPGLTWVQGAMAQQAAAGAANTVVGSGPISIGVRIAMMRSWGVSDRSCGITIVAINVIAAYALWIVTAATSIVGLVGDDPIGLDRRILPAVLTGSVVVLTVSTLMWWLVLTRPGATAFLAGWSQIGFDRLRRRVRRLPKVDLERIAEAARLESGELIRARGWWITLATIADQAVKVATPLVVVRAIGIPASVLSTKEVLVAYGVIRLAGALSPLPGGLGVTEFGLTELLVRSGGPEAAVLAAVLIYRLMTYIAPMALGGASFVIWRWRARRPGPGRSPAAGDRPAPTSTPGAGDGGSTSP